MEQKVPNLAIPAQQCEEEPVLESKGMECLKVVQANTPSDQADRRLSMPAIHTAQSSRLSSSAASPVPSPAASPVPSQEGSPQHASRARSVSIPAILISPTGQSHAPSLLHHLKTLEPKRDCLKINPDNIHLTIPGQKRDYLPEAEESKQLKHGPTLAMEGSEIKKPASRRGRIRNPSNLSPQPERQSRKNRFKRRMSLPVVYTPLPSPDRSPLLTPVLSPAGSSVPSPAGTPQHAARAIGVSIPHQSKAEPLQGLLHQLEILELKQNEVLENTNLSPKREQEDKQEGDEKKEKTEDQKFQRQCDQHISAQQRQKAELEEAKSLDEGDDGISKEDGKIKQPTTSMCRRRMISAASAVRKPVDVGPTPERFSRKNRFKRRMSVPVVYTPLPSPVPSPIPSPADTPQHGVSIPDLFGSEPIPRLLHRLEILDLEQIICSTSSDDKNHTFPGQTREQRELEDEQAKHKEQEDQRQDGQYLALQEEMAKMEGMEEPKRLDKHQVGLTFSKEEEKPAYRRRKISVASAVRNSADISPKWERQSGKNRFKRRLSVPVIYTPLPSPVPSPPLSPVLSPAGSSVPSPPLNPVLSPAGSSVPNPADMPQNEARANIPYQSEADTIPGLLYKLQILELEQNVDPENTREQERDEKREEPEDRKSQGQIYLPSSTQKAELDGAEELKRRQDGHTPSKEEGEVKKPAASRRRMISASSAVRNPAGIGSEPVRQSRKNRFKRRMSVPVVYTPLPSPAPSPPLSPVLSPAGSPVPSPAGTPQRMEKVSIPHKSEAELIPCLLHTTELEQNSTKMDPNTYLTIADRREKDLEDGQEGHEKHRKEKTFQCQDLYLSVQKRKQGETIDPQGMGQWKREDTCYGRHMFQEGISAEPSEGAPLCQSISLSVGPVPSSPGSSQHDTTVFIPEQSDSKHIPGLQTMEPQNSSNNVYLPIPGKKGDGQGGDEKKNSRYFPPSSKQDKMTGLERKEKLNRLEEKKREVKNESDVKKPPASMFKKRKITIRAIRRDPADPKPTSQEKSLCGNYVHTTIKSSVKSSFGNPATTSHAW